MFIIFHRSIRNQTHGMQLKIKKDELSHTKQLIVAVVYIFKITKKVNFSHKKCVIMSENEDLFTSRMRKATRNIHSVSDALVNAKFAICEYNFDSFSCSYCFKPSHLTVKRTLMFLFYTFSSEL